MKILSANIPDDESAQPGSAGRLTGFNNKIKIAGQATGTTGVWQRGYWDRYVRDEKHFYQAIEYIKKNFNNGGVLLG